VTRRGALALMAIMVRAMSGKLSADQPPPPATIRIDLGYFKEWHIEHKGKQLTITPDDLWTALGGH